MSLSSHFNSLRSKGGRRSGASNSGWTAPAHENRQFAYHYPNFPPPEPQIILRNASTYWRSVEGRRFPYPLGETEDAPLFALYRLYEALLLDRKQAYQEILQTFWDNANWKVADIPDPERTDQHRYAFLAATTFVIARSFNTRMTQGMVRGSDDSKDLDEPRGKGKGKNAVSIQAEYEYAPEWASWVNRLSQTWCVPTRYGIYLSSKEDPRADEDFLKKNILICTPDVYFA